MKKIRYEIKGMSCAACVSHVERAACKIVGKESLNVSLLANSLTVTVEEDTDEKKLYSSLKKALSDAGYGIKDPDASDTEDTEKTKRKDLKKWIASALITLLLMYIAMGDMMGIPVPSLLTENGVVFASVQLLLALLVIGIHFKFYRNGFSALFHKAPNMDSLIAIGSSASMIYGLVAIGCMAYGYATGQHEWIHRYYHNLYFESAAMILTLVALGKMLEGRAKAGASQAIRRLAAMMPKSQLRSRHSIVRLCFHLRSVAVSSSGTYCWLNSPKLKPISGVITFSPSAIMVSIPPCWLASM